MIGYIEISNLLPIEKIGKSLKYLVPLYSFFLLLIIMNKFDGLT